MQIEKAIEILALNLEEVGASMPPDCREALHLGIEALKQVEESRFEPSTWEPRLLPGETEK